MPPPLALLICTVFVFCLLRMERRLSPDVSSGMWVPTIWMVLIASKPLGIWFGSIGEAEDGSLPDRLALFGLFLAGVVILSRRRFNWAAALRDNIWLVLLLGFLFVSTFWSDITFIAIRRWIRYVIVVIMGFIVVAEENPPRALESLLRRSMYVLIPFSLLLVKYYPALGVDFGRWSGLQMWIGVTLHKNSLGRLCLIASFFLLWMVYSRWRDGARPGGRYQNFADLLVLLISVHLFMGADDAYSATAIGSFIIGMATYLGLAWLRKLRMAPSRPVLTGVMTLLLAFGIATPFLGGSNMAGLTSTMGRDETLTGRTETWAQLVPVVQSEPLLGVGFASFWTTERRDFYQMSHGHNGYLDVLLDVGATGLALYCIFLLSCGRKLHSLMESHHSWAAFGICLLLMTIVYNVSESALNSLDEQMTATVIIVVLALTTRRSNSLSPQYPQTVGHGISSG